MKRLIVILFIAVMTLSCSKKEEASKPPEKESIVRNFFVLRKAGDVGSAWYLLSEKTRKNITAEQFKQYCFVYKVMDFELKEKKDGFQHVSYSFYDKKMGKDGKLHNYFITKTDEYLAVDKTGILFPHVGFLALREAIKQKNTEKAKQIIQQMLELNPRQPEVIETAKNMDLL